MLRPSSTDMAFPARGVSSEGSLPGARRREASGAERWWARVCLVAALGATVELGAALWAFPTAASDEAGLIVAWLGVYWVFALLSIPLAAALAVLERQGVLRRCLERPGFFLHALVPMASSAAAFATVESAAWNSLQIRVQEIRAVGLTLAVGASWLASSALVALVSRHAPAAARLADRHGLRVSFVTAMAACAWIVHAVLAPANADAAVASVGAAQLALSLLASIGALPGSRALPRWVPRACVAVWLGAAVLWSLSPHARFVVRGHCPTATSLWALLDRFSDFDGDGAAPRWLGGTDCAELDAARGPLLREIPGDGVDQDCRGGDAPPEPPPLIESPWPGCSAPSDSSVLLITVDAMRADALSPEITPELARFTAHAVQFERAYPPASMTGGTTLSMMMGRATIDLNTRNVYTDPEIVVTETIAENLRRSGFRTFAFLPFELHPAVLNGFEPPRHARPRDHVVETHKRLLAAELSNQLLEEIAGSSQKFFGWVHYPDLHAPYVLARDGDASTAAGYARGGLCRHPRRPRAPLAARRGAAGEHGRHRNVGPRRAARQARTRRAWPVSLRRSRAHPARAVGSRLRPTPSPLPGQPAAPRRHPEGPRGSWAAAEHVVCAEPAAGGGGGAERRMERRETSGLRGTAQAHRRRATRREDALRSRS